ncbi:uncharacterized protein B0495.5-like [Varroa destructor]|uniref:Spermatogenesis-associated protein 20-like TRX domain-containing protein n=1 Tax=Varroa destructor TaxID=109461 RepID=A0A7M7K7L3_VARDE|nr:uncharacterized protein B0495.5-like [Varroa destructor]
MPVYVSDLFVHSGSAGSSTAVGAIISCLSSVRTLMFTRLGAQWRASPALLFKMARSCSGTSSSNRDASSCLNRLGNERSPYLLQHATNPVAWYPWGDEAFEAARRDNKLIFLSIGYSTCHWCHVMERESFENEEVARLLNDHFISIKVDREERPDIDKIYMTYVQVTSGGGGWPLSIWLTPQLKPVLGGTYFPPDDNPFGAPGFKTVLRTLHKKWKSSSNEKMLQDSERITGLLARAADIRLDEEVAEQFNPADTIARCLDMLENHFDFTHCGFGRSPKFPQCVNANFLLTLHMSKGDLKAFNIVEKQLLAMARGGIHDHLAGGFHRYSVDSEWHVPHFEKMLYDQAQLLCLYALATRVTMDQENSAIFREVAESIGDYVNRDLSHPEGGFYSAEDADSFGTFDDAKGRETTKSKNEGGVSHKKEGAFYVWTWSEIHEVLSETEAKVFCEYYSIDEHGNVDPQMDPHGELLNQNVLITRTNIASFAHINNMSETDVRNTIESAKRKLFKRRLQNRPRPHLDNKIVTAWNGLMISGMAKAARCLDRPDYAERSLVAVDFIRKYLYKKHNNTLLRSVYTEGEGDCAQVRQLNRPIQGVLDDYAFLIQGLLDLYDSTMDETLLILARDLQETQDRLFWDVEDGGYYLSSSFTKDIIFKVKDDQDGAEPSANSVAISNLVRLETIFNKDEYRTKASKLIKLFAERLSKIPIALPEMVNSVLRHSSPPTKVVLSSPKGDVSSMKAVCDRVVHPFMVVLRSHPNSLIDLGGSFACVDGQTTAYVCKDFTCQAPITDKEKLLETLQ